MKTNRMWIHILSTPTQPVTYTASTPPKSQGKRIRIHSQFVYLAAESMDQKQVVQVTNAFRAPTHSSQDSNTALDHDLGQISLFRGL